MSDGSDPTSAPGPIPMLNTGVDGMKSNGSGNGALSLNMVGHFQFEAPGPDVNYPEPVDSEEEEEHPDDKDINTDVDEVSDAQWENFWKVVLSCVKKVKSPKVAKMLEEEAKGHLFKPNPRPTIHQPAPPLPQRLNLLPWRRWLI